MPCSHGDAVAVAGPVGARLLLLASHRLPGRISDALELRVKAANVRRLSER